MAIYDFQLLTIKRSAGRSATAASAYRGGGCLTDDRTGEVFDYRRRRGVCSNILVPAGLSVPSVENGSTLQEVRSRLWNAAEAAEVRRNAVTAREIRLALPHELTQSQNEDLTVAFVREVIEELSVAAEVAFHDAPDGGDPRNRHVHVLITTREVLEGFAFGRKTRCLDDRATGSPILSRWRQRWAEMANDMLRASGHDARIDHRSLEERGIEREPNRHHGPFLTREIRALQKRNAAIAGEILKIEAEMLESALAAWPVEPIEEVAVSNLRAVEDAWIEAASQIRQVDERVRLEREFAERDRADEETLVRIRERMTRIKAGPEAAQRLKRLAGRVYARMVRQYDEIVIDIANTGRWRGIQRKGKDWPRALAQASARDGRDRTVTGQRRLALFFEDASRNFLKIYTVRALHMKIISEGPVQIGSVQPPASARGRTRQTDRRGEGDDRSIMGGRIGMEAASQDQAKKAAELADAERRKELTRRAEVVATEAQAAQSRERTAAAIAHARKEQEKGSQAKNKHQLAGPPLSGVRPSLLYDDQARRHPATSGSSKTQKEASAENDEPEKRKREKMPPVHGKGGFGWVPIGKTRGKRKGNKAGRPRQR